ncbi:hypothetical protein FUA48_10720 [Flavobacterium alkalisoli]|uniref:Uncharacterized protein n=1 Tax=Flavobacterium alkalisoli TaxID=2602769 RepID=A0A5B9FVD9_9FLAO|nr:hypothetical protein [Flavobacterium alkalisoli]QEE50036.1 hypothetical protein FUA48_10720 [Flavobacterium alkalisoli]
MSKDSIIYHILKRCLQLFVIFMLFGLFGQSYLNIFPTDAGVVSWLVLIPIILFAGVVIRDNIIRFKKRKNEDSKEESTDHPAVTLFVKRIVQFFFIFVVLKIVIVMTLMMLHPGAENSHTAHSIVNIVPLLWFLGIIIWDFFKRYKLNRAEEL